MANWETTVELTPELLRYSPRGVDCVFVKDGEKGIKLYRDRGVRDRALLNQIRLQELGDYAP